MSSHARVVDGLFFDSTVGAFNGQAETIYMHHVVLLAQQQIEDTYILFLTERQIRSDEKRRNNRVHCCGCRRDHGAALPIRATSHLVVSSFNLCKRLSAMHWQSCRWEETGKRHLCQQLVGIICYRWEETRKRRFPVINMYFDKLNSRR